MVIQQVVDNMEVVTKALNPNEVSEVFWVLYCIDAVQWSKLKLRSMK